MIFDTIIQPNVNVGECVEVQFVDGNQYKRIFGIVSRIDKKYIWLKQSKDSPDELRFNLKLDKVIKMN